MTSKKKVHGGDHQFYELAKAILRSPEGKKVKSIDDLMGKDGLITKMLKPMMQDLLQAEMDEHLGYKKHQSPGYIDLDNKPNNYRNGSYNRTLRGSGGRFQVEMPRDRNGEFQSVIIPHYKQVTSELEQKIIYLYALGTSTRDITSFIEETYGLEVSPAFISNVTDKIMDLASAWQVRILDEVYPIVYLDAIHVKCREREGGKVINRAVHIVMGLQHRGTKGYLGTLSSRYL